MSAPKGLRRVGRKSIPAQATIHEDLPSLMIELRLSSAKKKQPAALPHNDHPIVKKEETVPYGMSKNPWANSLLGKKPIVADSRNVIYDEDLTHINVQSSSSDDAAVVLTPDSAQSHLSLDGNPTSLQHSLRTASARQASASPHVAHVAFPQNPNSSSETYRISSQQPHYNTNDNGNGKAVHWKSASNIPTNDDKEDNSDEENHRPTKRKANSQKERKEFACPYYKQYPNEEMIDRKCNNAKSEVYRVKSHIIEIHSPITRCQRCKKLFKTDLERDGHVQHERCEWQDGRHLFSATTLMELVKRSNQHIPEESVWRHMFKLVLPHVHDDNIPTPYWERLPSVRTFAEFRQYLFPDSTDSIAEDFYRGYLQNIGIQGFNSSRNRAAAASQRTRTLGMAAPSVPSNNRQVHTESRPEQTSFLPVQDFASGSNSAYTVPQTFAPSQSTDAHVWTDLNAQQSNTSSSIPTMHAAPNNDIAINSSFHTPHQYNNRFNTYLPSSMPPAFHQSGSSAQSVQAAPMYMNGLQSMQPASQYPPPRRDRANSVMAHVNMAPSFAHPSFSGMGSESLPQRPGSTAPERGPFNNFWST